MTQMLGLSLDCASSPTIELLNDASARNGWGLAWYPSGDWAAAVVKDPESSGRDPATLALSEWKTFRSTVFIGHIRGAAKRRTQQDTHPFMRSHAGRSWVLAHNGDLEHSRLATELPLGSPPVFEPLGRTDSEHLFCWLLTRIREIGARRLDDLGWPRLYELLTQINGIGQLNLLVTDGLDLVAYRDRRGFGSLNWIRRIPPHPEERLGSRSYRLMLDGDADANRSMVICSTVSLSADPAWKELAPGEMLVARLSEVRALLRPLGAGAPVEVRPAPALPGPAPAPPPRRRTAPRELEVRHTTVYTYEEPVEHSTHLFRLRPVNDDLQQLLSHQLIVEPATTRYAFDDVFGNHAVRTEIEIGYRELRIEATSRVRLLDTPALGNAGHKRLTIPLVWMPWQREMMQPFLLPPELPETQLVELSGYAMSFVERQDYDLVESLQDINRTIYRDYAYVPGSTRLETTPFDVYAHRRGVCQDFANLFICLARLLGVPARYRVGYIHTGADYENQRQSEASHAWVELYLPWIGWRGFDPTNGCLAGLDHVRVACGRNFRDATPTSGTLYRGGGTETLRIAVRVEDVTG